MRSMRDDRDYRYHKRPSAIRLFFVTFGIVLFLGAFLLVLLAYVKSADRRAEGISTIAAIKEELIPEVLIEEEIPKEEEEAPEGTSLTASDNIVKTASGDYMITETKDPDAVTFAFAGDVLLDERYAIASSINQRGGKASSSFDEEALSICRSADVFMVNNEFPYSNRGTPTQDKTYTFRADPKTAKWLPEMGVDIVSLANNHAYDYGEEALLDTVSTLDDLKLIHVGAGKNLEEAEKPAYFTVDGMTIAILNSTQVEQVDNPDTKGATETTAGVFRCWNDQELLRMIREAKMKADYVIVYIHWGTEKETAPDYNQTSRQQAMADAGADLIIGDHPHVLQPFAAVGETLVVYSLGNFLFTSYDTDTGVFEVTLCPSTKTVTSMQFIPMLQSGCAVKTLKGSEKERVLTMIRDGSSGVTIDEEGYVRFAN